MANAKKSETKVSKGLKVDVPRYENLPIANPKGFYLPVERGLHVLNGAISKVKEGNSWQGPAGILLTILLTFATADFKNALGFNADTWSAIAIIVGAIALFMLVKSLYFKYKHRNFNAKSILKELREPEE